MKKLILGCALAIPAMVGLMNLAYTPEAEALPASSCESEFYSDGTYTTVVGGQTILCNGQRVSWGTRTSFVRSLGCEPC